MIIYPSIVNVVKNKNETSVRRKESDNFVVQSKLSNVTTPFLSSNYYLSFKGGDSLNLLQTMNNFYEAEALNDKKIVPDRVKEAAQFVVEAGNPQELTLIDVHKYVYSDLLHAETLDEVAEKFPEFSDVKSMHDVDSRTDSLISDVKAGKCEIFSQEEDLALQLLKLYWAEGYSLNDLEKYTNGKKNMGYIMKKLNIPRVDKHYGIVLKLSDKEYNERFAETLKLKSVERYESNSGHIYIPRGPLSREQKDKISKSLADYYVKNPERVYLQSLRQREFYKNNPDMASLFREVLFDAWRLGSSKPVKAAMSKFFTDKKFALPSDKSLSDVNGLGAKKRLLMQEFWDKNPDAKKQFSRSMQSAWSRVHKIRKAKEDCMVIDNSFLPAYPKKIAESMKNWVVKRGYDEDSIIVTLSVTVGDFNQNLANKSMGAKLVTEYFEKNPIMSDIYADSLIYSLGELRQYLSLQRSTSGDIAIKKIENAVKGKSFMSVNELVCLYLDVIRFLLSSENVEALTKLVHVLENCYDEVILMRKKYGYPVPNDK